MRNHVALLAGMLVVSGSGCAIAPHAGPTHGGTVTGDVMGYLNREWPLDGTNCQTVTREGTALASPGPLMMTTPEEPPLLRREPMVPAAPGTPGRFFPAPTRPPFAGDPAGLGPAGIPAIPMAPSGLAPPGH